MDNFGFETETSVAELKQLISRTLDEKLEDCVLEDRTGFIAPPMKARLITPGNVEGLPDKLGELTLAQVTTAEVEDLVKGYLKDIKSMDDYKDAYGYDFCEDHIDELANDYADSSVEWKAYKLANSRINAFIEARAITKLRVNELYAGIESSGITVSEGPNDEQRADVGGVKSSDTFGHRSED